MTGETPQSPARGVSFEGRTYVIAEIGVNHDGDTDKALDLVRAVADSGADAVKVQTFTAESLVSHAAPKAAYQLVTTPTSESQFEMLKRLELSRPDHWVVMAEADRLGLDFLSTPYDRESLAFLVDELGVDQLKIASSDITNLPLLLAAGRSGRRVILSTGMSTMAEIRDALGTLGFGGTTDDSVPSRADIESLDSDKVGAYLASHVVLMQCTSQYPAPIDEANLAAIPTLRDSFGVDVGYSDHTIGTVAAIMSVAYGSVMYERHFTLDRRAPGPDHSASMEPAEFARVVALIREAESARGTGLKEPTPSERDNRYPMRKSLVAATTIQRGQVLREGDIGMMRPVDGDAPARYWEWLGRPSPRGFIPGEPLVSEDAD
ncbi:MAG: N-acetylneuraminate synthase family protein [Actinomycetota bacterium]|nr:N-acetylneuraminate synthase family protein [Actinomycetota bacterium]